MKRDYATELDFLKSALTLDNALMPTENFLAWMEEKKQAVKVDIDMIRFSEMDQWGFAADSNLRHHSGKFFSIEGIAIDTSWGNVNQWSQPIINQPEIGFLGIIVKKINGILHFLMQAKIEPGNINYVQLSPTLQATKSNYTKVHKGRAPLYLEYFRGEKSGQTRVLLDQLQSEQGARFLKKRNRNIIIEVTGDMEVYDNFCWLTLGQIKEALRHDNIVNMDTRTVISGIPVGSYRTEVIRLYETLLSTEKNYKTSLLTSFLDEDRSLHRIEDIISWITRQKSEYELDVKSIPLKEVQRWVRDDFAIYHEDKKYFSVVPVRATISNREVTSWTQPLVKSAQEGIIAFIIKKIKGVYHFLVQAKLEAGNFDIVELAPTVQCLTGNYRESNGPPFIHDVLEAPKEQVRYDTLQSEEGGRFYREQNRNIIVEMGEEFPLEVPSNYMWITLNQLNTFIMFNNYLNIQSRSLLSSISFV